MEVVDDQQRVRQHLPDCGLEHRAHVDCRRPDLVTPGLRTSRESAGDRSGGAAFDLGE
nr:hypothetical protein [Salinispora vitiensis]